MVLCVLPLCLVLGGIANAGYWMFRQPPIAFAQGPSEPTDPAEFASLPTGDAAAGEQLFTGPGGCSACHSLDADVRIVGPSLFDISTRAAARKTDYTAEMYIYESITNPNAYVVDGFPGLMPAEYAKRFSDQQFADLIAFLMTR